MQGRCDKHLFEGAEDRCGKCGMEFCGECLVYAFGPKKPPMCIPCAVAAAGIRASAGNRPALGKTELKRLQKERVSAFKRFRRSRPAAVAPAAESEPVGQDQTMDSMNPLNSANGTASYDEPLLDGTTATFPLPRP